MSIVMMMMMVVVVVVVGRIRMPRRGVTRPQCSMYLLTATPLDEVDRMGNNTVGKKHLHVLPHSLDTPGKRHHKGAFDRSSDGPRQGRKRCVFQRRGEQEMHDPRCMSLDQR